MPVLCHHGCRSNCCRADCAPCGSRGRAGRCATSPKRRTCRPDRSGKHHRQTRSALIDLCPCCGRPGRLRYVFVVEYVTARGTGRYRVAGTNCDEALQQAIRALLGLECTSAVLRNTFQTKQMFGAGSIVASDTPAAAIGDFTESNGRTGPLPSPCIPVETPKQEEARPDPPAPARVVLWVGRVRGLFLTQGWPAGRFRLKILTNEQKVATGFGLRARRARVLSGAAGSMNTAARPVHFHDTTIAGFPQRSAESGLWTFCLLP